MEEFFVKATDPHQYDKQLMNWQEEGSKESPSRKYFQYYLLPELNLEGKSVVDIGCGMGHMTNFLEEKGAVEIVGFDPSENNIATAKAKYPSHNFEISTLEEYPTIKKFDVAISIMVFEHIGDVRNAFKKVNSLLKDNGQFYLVSGDKEYSIKPRMNYELEVHDVDENTVVAKTKRAFGVLYDIFRSPDFYISLAEEEGLVLEKHVYIEPNDEIIEMIPRYADYKGITTGHLFIFRKK